MLTNLVFQVTLISFANVLGQIAVEGKGRRIGGKLGYILDADEFSLY